jgi:hypothetical protein
LKISITRDVYKDKVTGVCYSKEFASMPVALIAGDGPATSRGAILKLYGGHPDLKEYDIIQEAIGFENAQECTKRLGFYPLNFAQKLFVTEEQLAERFQYLGQFSEEVDMDAQIQQYESECVDFSNRKSILNGAKQQLSRSGGHGLGACILYTLIKEYQSNTAK